mmetsp:Transcript_26326/g.52500  ORF Transcript_26326/g.52500 Transcript_26326/m.52500 type:complete len:209 (+) Transcript_26326:47-673(+)
MMQSLARRALNLTPYRSLNLNPNRSLVVLNVVNVINVDPPSPTLKRHYAASTTPSGPTPSAPGGCVVPTANAFHSLSNSTLTFLTDEVLEAVDGRHGDALDFDADLSDGVLSLRLGGTDWVVNKQGPNRQVWWSSPVSGPLRFNWEGRAWRDSKEGRDLVDMLVGEVGDVVVEGTGDEEWVEEWKQQVEEARGEWEESLEEVEVDEDK